MIGRLGEMSAREEILQRLAGAGTDPAAQPPLPPIYTSDRSMSDRDSSGRDTSDRDTSDRTGTVGEPTARFVARATDVGAEVRLVGAADLAGAVVDVVTAAGGREVVAWEDPLLADAAGALRAAGVAVLDDGSRAPDAAASAAFGLTTADYAIAETGTLVLVTGPGRSRAASLLPGHHLAILPEDRIHADLFALMETLHHPLPSALTFITGPSRSADIGLTPVRPAHGPMTVTILIVVRAPTP
jgi:L-lactate utilization protein LutC